MFSFTTWSVLDFLVRAGLLVALIGGVTFIGFNLFHLAISFHRAGMGRLEKHGLIEPVRHGKHAKTVENAGSR